MAKTTLILSLLAALAVEPRPWTSPSRFGSGKPRASTRPSCGSTSLRCRGIPRCPKGTNCLVPGEARLVVRAELGSRRVELLFKVPPGGSDTQTVDRFKVTVTSLEPQTEADRRIEVSDYVATLRVTAEGP